MDTLSRETWNGFFESKEHYLKLRALWAQLHTEPEQLKLGPEHYLLMSALRGRDWRRGFTPVTNSNKLAHGAKPRASAATALWNVRSPYNRKYLLEVFGGLVTEEMVNAACSWLPDRVDPAKVEIESAYLSPAVSG